jgi:hypothetical protein
MTCVKEAIDGHVSFGGIPSCSRHVRIGCLVCVDVAVCDLISTHPLNNLDVGDNRMASCVSSDG